MTSPNTEALVARLRERVSTYPYSDGSDHLMDEAADTLSALVKENTRLVEAVAVHVTVRGEYYERALAAEARLATALGALEVAREFAWDIGDVRARNEFKAIIDAALPVEEDKPDEG